MIQSDLRKTNQVVDQNLTVRGALVVGTNVQTSNLVVTGTTEFKGSVLFSQTDTDIANLFGNEFKTANLTVTNIAIINDLVVTTGTIGTLNSTTGTIATLNSTTGTITTLNATTGTITTLNATTGTITTLNSTTGTITTLNATTGTITNLSVPGAITLATTGGTASALNYYEEFSGTMNFTSASLAADQTVNIFITRYGNVVSILLEGFIVVSNGTPGTLITTAATSFPSRFRPIGISATGRSYCLKVFDNTASIVGLINLGIGADNGRFTIFRGSVIGTGVDLTQNFSGVNNIGFGTITLSWII